MDEMLELIKNIQVIYAFSIVLVSSVSAVAVAVINSRGQRKTKKYELIFNAKSSAYFQFIGSATEAVFLILNGTFPIESFKEFERLVHAVGLFCPATVAKEINSLSDTLNKIQDLLPSNNAASPDLEALLDKFEDDFEKIVLDLKRDLIR